MDKEFTAWFANQWRHGKLQQLFSIIGDMQRNAAICALNRGDTEFEKGQVQALEEVMSIPKQVGDTVEETSKDETQSETP